MKKTILTVAGSALIALFSVQFAAAAEPHHGRHHQRSDFRNSNAFVEPAPAAYDYSYGWSAPAGR